MNFAISTYSKHPDEAFDAAMCMRSPENQLIHAQNGNEPLSMRRRALDAANRSGASIAEMIKLYDTTTDPSMKETIVGIYIRNSERASVDKLLSIIKTEENMSLRKRTITRLSTSEDPRIKQALQDLIAR